MCFCSSFVAEDLKCTSILALCFHDSGGFRKKRRERCKFKPKDRKKPAHEHRSTRRLDTQHSHARPASTSTVCGLLFVTCSLSRTGQNAICASLWKFCFTGNQPCGRCLFCLVTVSCPLKCERILIRYQLQSLTL